MSEVFDVWTMPVEVWWLWIVVFSFAIAAMLLFWYFKRWVDPLLARYLPTDGVVDED